MHSFSFHFSIKRHRARCARRRGFTLLELLTVIAIVGVLTAILVPALGRVKASAANATCVSNLRTLYQAIGIFASDRGSIPRANGESLAVGNTLLEAGRTWRAALIGAGTLGQPKGSSANPNDWTSEQFDIFTCHPHMNFYQSQFGYPDGKLVSTYTMNNIATSYHYLKFAFFTHPEQTMLISDGTLPEAAGTFNAATQGGAPDVNAHNGHANIAFADGHVEGRTAAQIPVEIDVRTIKPGQDTRGYYFWRTQ